MPAASLHWVVVEAVVDVVVLLLVVVLLMVLLLVVLLLMVVVVVTVAVVLEIVVVVEVVVEVGQFSPHEPGQNAFTTSEHASSMPAMFTQVTALFHSVRSFLYNSSMSPSRIVGQLINAACA
jgi:ABC-type multidrug transport system fused ATPase/permease subunit